ncbi:hypothetical protein [Algoriella sp.]|uniref:hypothetical protein n=1 Tax=Algoriella sp. TaxID=1872434 RepID=UPI001B1C62B3|nr:hypothetical protein [Algoriella sp.]MBO6211960.1 hypothetical protein [Algoriella sp.]
MYSYTLNHLVQFSKLNEQMIVLWNKKYKIFNDEKIDKSSLFTQDDLKKLIIVSFLANSNARYTVEKLCAQSISELTVVTEFELQNFLKKNKDFSPLINLLVCCCFTYDAKSFDSILSICFKQLGIEECCVKVVFPLISQLAILLDTNSVHSAIKSFTKNLIRKQLHFLIKSTPYSVDNNRTWLLFLPENEFHDIELLYAHLLLKLDGEKSIYLGDNQTKESINECLNTINITHVFTYISDDYDKDKMKDYLAIIKKIYPTSTIFVATYNKLKEPITEEIPYINVNNPIMFKEYLDKIMTM